MSYGSIDGEDRRTGARRSTGAFSFVLDGAQPLPYLLALPPGGCEPTTPLLICVHGVTRRAMEHALAFAAPAAAARAALLVPLFLEHEHRRYAQLIHPRSGARSDLALIDTVQAVRESYGLNDAPGLLFGFSAGAQFAHRFALAHPHRLAGLALGAPGWYTWPDQSQPWPLGLGSAERWLGHPIDLSAFLRLPIRVWVGERETQADPALRSSPKIDALQGGARLQRASRWVMALHEAAQALGIRADVALHTIARCRHDFTQCARRGALAEAVVEFLVDRWRAFQLTRCRADLGACATHGPG